jgi:hypothetical protein
MPSGEGPDFLVRNNQYRVLQQLCSSQRICCAMAYFEDLSAYAYQPRYSRPGTRNVGWLARGHEFDTMIPTEDVLDRLWNVCKISVAQTRGLHDCDLCPTEDDNSHFVERNGETLLLGSAEIRVFSKSGTIYASPTLIYHYVACHHYLPPEDFIEALTGAAAQPDHQYLARLVELGLDWNKTSNPSTKPVRRRLGQPPSSLE